MSEQAFNDHVTKERENDRWVAYQKEGLPPDKIIMREKDWANTSLKSAISSWNTCVLLSMAGGFAVVVFGGLLYFMRDSTMMWVVSCLGILAGVAALALFVKPALRKPMLHKTRSWLLAEQQLSGGKK